MDEPVAEERLGMAGHALYMSTTPKIEGYECKDIHCFKAIYEEWIDLLTELAKQWKQGGDFPWWYNERASLSLFAGAIWLAGGHCLEEYSEKKREIRRQTHRLGNPYTGRIDLYFSWHRFDFIAEAKATWSGFTHGNKSARHRLVGGLKEARNAIRGAEPDRRQRRLAILFARPYFKKRAEERIDELLNTWVASLADLDTSSYAWGFPQCVRHKYADDGNCYPGEAVLIREVWK